MFAMCFKMQSYSRRVYNAQICGLLGGSLTATKHDPDAELCWVLPCRRRQMASPTAQWDPRQVASVRKRVARCSPRFRLHVLLLQVRMEDAQAEILSPCPA